MTFLSYAETARERVRRTNRLRGKPASTGGTRRDRKVGREETLTMSSVFSTVGLARISARRPWRVLAVWLVVLILAGFAATGLGDVLTTESTFTNTPESLKGDNLLEARMRDGGERPITETVIVTAESANVDDAAFKGGVRPPADDFHAM